MARVRTMAGVLAVAAGLALIGVTGVSAQLLGLVGPERETVIYDGDLKLDSGGIEVTPWGSGSYESVYDETYVGPEVLKVTSQGPYQGIVLRLNRPADLTEFTASGHGYLALRVLPAQGPKPVVAPSQTTGGSRQQPTSGRPGSTRGGTARGRRGGPGAAGGGPMGGLRGPGAAGGGPMGGPRGPGAGGGGPMGGLRGPGAGGGPMGGLRGPGAGGGGPMGGLRGPGAGGGGPMGGLRGPGAAGGGPMGGLRGPGAGRGGPMGGLRGPGAGRGGPMGGLGPGASGPAAPGAPAGAPGAAPAANEVRLRHVRVVLFTDAGAMIADGVPVDGSIKDARGWIPVSIALSDFRGAPGSQKVRAVGIFADESDVLYVGRVSLLVDRSVVRATLKAIPSVARVGEMIEFSVTLKGGPIRPLISWDFDRADGIQREAVGGKVKYVYKSPGDYLATCTITDKAGVRAQMTEQIGVHVE